MAASESAALWLVVAVAVTRLLKYGQANQAPPEICSMSCCRGYPSCQEAISITCNCGKTEQIVLRSASFPKSVQTINITGVQVTIEDHAVSRLPDLVSLAVRRSRTLEIRKDGLLLQSSSKLRTLRIFRVQSVTIHGSAFSGTWSDANIQMQHIDTLSVKQYAFNYSSPSSGPSLAMYKVGVLQLASNAFTAPVTRLAISTTDMPSCPRNSFTGNIHCLVLHRVTISEAKTGCVNSDRNSMAELSIHSCTVVNIHTGAFSGHISEVLLNNTYITSVQEKGFQIQATNLKMHSSHIVDLSSRGLTVAAMNSILLNNVMVETLKRHALIGLKVDKSRNGNVQPLAIQTLKISKAEDGSLAFAECMPVSIIGLSVTRPRPQVCPTVRWTRQLVGSDARNQLTEAEYQVYQNLLRSVSGLHFSTPCTNDDYNQARIPGVDLRCTNSSDDPQGTGGVEHPHRASGADRTQTSHRPGGTHSTDTSHRPGGTHSTDTSHSVGGTRETGTAHGTGVSGNPPTSLPPGVGDDDASLGDPTQDHTGGGGLDGLDGPGRLALYCSLGVGVPLVLTAAGTACLLVRRRQTRAATVARPPDKMQQTRGDELQRRRHESSAPDSRPPQRRPDPAGHPAASDTTPVVCDYAEVLTLGSSALSNSDYAEITESGVYAEPVASTGSGAPRYGDYAEIPPPLDTATDGAGSQVCDYDEIVPAGHREAGRPLARAPAPEEAVYAEICQSTLLTPPVVPILEGSRRDSGEAPPLPPITEARLQMGHAMLENELYVSTDEITRPGARGMTPTVSRRY